MDSAKQFSTKAGSFTANKFRIDGDAAYIELTDRFGVCVCEAIVSAEDAERVVSAGRWHAQHRRHVSYAGRSYRENGKAKMEWLHRFIFAAPPGMEIDHINHNGLDNRRDNLRLVTSRENDQNRRSIGRTPESGARNVYWEPRNQVWFVKITVDGIQHYCGNYKSLTDAEKAAEKARRAHHPLAFE